MRQRRGSVASRVLFEHPEGEALLLAILERVQFTSTDELIFLLSVPLLPFFVFLSLALPQRKIAFLKPPHWTCT